MIDYDAEAPLSRRRSPVERSSAVRYTYQDLQSIPWEVRRHEILDGKLYVTPSPRIAHQRVALTLGAMMDALARRHGLGEIIPAVSVHVHDELVFEPDLTFVRADRMAIADPESHVHGVPDLAVEVLSPSNRSYDQNLKRLHYMECGLPELWLVDIDARTIEVWRPGADGPERIRDSITWRVGDASFDLPFEEIFRGV